MIKVVFWLRFYVEIKGHIKSAACCRSLYQFTIINKAHPAWAWADWLDWVDFNPVNIVRFRIALMD